MNDASPSDPAFELPDEQEFAAALDSVLKYTIECNLWTDVGRNVSYFGAVYMYSELYPAFRDTALAVIQQGIDSNRLQEAMEVLICHTIQIGWQAAMKHQSNNR